MNEPILLDGAFREAQSPQDTFRAVSPLSGDLLPHRYPISSWRDLEAMLNAAAQAVEVLRRTPASTIAAFLEAFADEIEARADVLADTAHQETALAHTPRLREVELSRTTGQLRQAASVASDASWRHPTIDTEANIRSVHAPLNGAVVVIGPNNFPFAFNAMSGSDLAGAIAAGNPVIAKGHPNHPRTTQLLAEAALAAVERTSVPRALVQMFYHCLPEDGVRLVKDVHTAALAFTGSRVAGLKLKAAADAGGTPAYLELSSINPLFILPGALRERADDIAETLLTSCNLGAGQFCTNPGLVVVVDGEMTRHFADILGARFSNAAPAVMLGEAVATNFRSAVETLVNQGAEIVARADSDEGRAAPTLLRVPAAHFLRDPEALQAEAFGPAALLVVAADEDELLQVTRTLEGNLTGTIYSAQSGQDDALYNRLEPLLRPRVGRLLNDKMPTGVAVSPAMNHGGPYPATGHPFFTAVGLPASALRFTALHCYDNVREDRLPEALRDANPHQVWRFVDGRLTQEAVRNEVVRG